MPDQHDNLVDRLAQALPAGLPFTYYHVSTPPTRCAALYSASPGLRPEKTFCESHILTVTSQNDQGQSPAEVAIFAMEVLIYTTAHLTTLFISKADSTGFLSSINILKGTVTPLRTLTSTFLSYMVRHRHRSNRKLVVSLFARAQDQYLFPGSIEHGKKHVLDDRGLVKWWCKTLDPVLREYPPGESGLDSVKDDEQIRSTGYLIVPGQDKHETAGLFPASTKKDETRSRRWLNGHPLRELSTNPHAPPRSLIPHFPDDPKSRFLDELDAEISDASTAQQSLGDSPSKRGAGRWKSVKTLAQFWEMMAYRQECASGRLVGFIWVVFDPPTQRPTPNSPSSPSNRQHQNPAPNTEPPPLFKKRRIPPPLTGPVHPRAPRIKPTTPPSTTTPHHPETTNHYHSPTHTRGTLVLPPKSYARATDLLLRLDFSNLAVARTSTAKWIHEVAVVGGVQGREWGVTVVGRKVAAVESEARDMQKTNISRGKRKGTDGVGDALSGGGGDEELGSGVGVGVNVLGSGTVRKKAKIETVGDDGGKEVNELGGRLVRRKMKV